MITSQTELLIVSSLVCLAVLIYLNIPNNFVVLLRARQDKTTLYILKNLKTIHIQFIHDWTEGSDNNWDEETLSSQCNKINLIFEKASQYAKSKSYFDTTGLRAINILWKQFKNDCNSAIKRKKLYGKTFSNEHTKQIQLLYQYAIKDELSRKSE